MVALAVPTPGMDSVVEKFSIKNEPPVKVEALPPLKRPFCRACSWDSGKPGLHTGASGGIRRDGDVSWGTTYSVHRDLERDGAACWNIRGKHEIDLVFPGEARRTAGEGRGDGDATNDDLNIGRACHVQDGSGHIIAGGDWAEPGGPRNQGLAGVSRRHCRLIEDAGDIEILIGFRRGNVILNDRKPSPAWSKVNIEGLDLTTLTTNGVLLTPPLVTVTL